MSNKANKYALLNKNEPEEIEMVDISEWQHNQPSHEASSAPNNGVDYVKLDDQTTQRSKANPIGAMQGSQPRPNNQKSSNQQYRQAAGNQQQSLVYPTYSANPTPARIQMNGNNYRLPNAVEQKRSQVPQMKVACEHCTYQQNVPGNVQIYVCCCCNNMNECFPLYGLFVCGHCQGKVCYPYGTSSMIRCTRCGTVNKVPTEPQKRYVKEVSKKSVDVPKKPEKKEVLLFDDEEIIVQEDNQPQRPMANQKVKQEQLSFDDFTIQSKRSKESSGYPNLE